LIAACRTVCSCTECLHIQLGPHNSRCNGVHGDFCLLLAELRRTLAEGTIFLYVGMDALDLACCTLIHQDICMMAVACCLLLTACRTASYLAEGIIFLYVGMDALDLTCCALIHQDMCMMAVACCLQDCVVPRGGHHLPVCGHGRTRPPQVAGGATGSACGC
jgi:hypothetical protein